jgi:DNA-directed RNA polymerase specialized sigma24 family protein
MPVPLPPPLAPDRRELAARYWPLACKLARDWPDPDEALGPAADGLMHAASRWLGRSRFPAYARRCIWGSIAASRGRGRRATAREKGAAIRAALCLPDPPPPGAASEARELARSLLGRLTPAERRLVLGRLEHRSVRDLAWEAGLEVREVGPMLDTAYAKMRRDKPCPCP